MLAEYVFDVDQVFKRLRKAGNLPELHVMLNASLVSLRIVELPSFEYGFVLVEVPSQVSMLRRLFKYWDFFVSLLHNCAMDEERRFTLLVWVSHHVGLSSWLHESWEHIDAVLLLFHLVITVFIFFNIQDELRIN